MKASAQAVQTVRHTAATAALLGLAALAAACTVAQPPSGNQSPSPASATATHSIAAPTTPSAPQSSAGVTGCASSALTVTVNTARASGAAGSIYYPLEFTNISGSTCTLFGYPGVSFVTGPSGSQIGRSALRNPVVAATTVSLAPGAVAHATLQVAEADNYDPAQCQAVTAHWLKIYPPNQFAAVYAPFTTRACSSRSVGRQLTISTIQPGAR